MDVYLTVFITALISSVVGAFVAAVVSQLKAAGKHTAEKKKSDEDLKEMIRQNTLMTCRMAIYDEHFSVDEKLDAYKVYRDNGGNHKTKTYMDEQVGGDVDAYLTQHGM